MKYYEFINSDFKETDLEFNIIYNKKNISKKYIIFSEEQNNINHYGHLLTDFISNLQYYKPGIKILIFGNINEIIHTILKIININKNDIVYFNNKLKLKEYIISNNLINNRNYNYNDIISTKYYYLNMYNFNYNLSNLYKKISSYYYNDKILIDKLYISRKNINNRKISNEFEIEDLFKKYNFNIIYPEQLSFKEQVQLFSNAKYICGPQGSGFHNIVFNLMPEKLKLLFLTSKKYILNFKYYICIEKYFNRDMYIFNDENIINIDKLEKCLKLWFKIIK